MSLRYVAFAFRWAEVTGVMPKEASATSGKEADKGAAAAVAGGGKDGTAGAKGSAPPAPAGGGGAVKGTPSKDLAGTGGKDASKNNKDNKDDGKTTSLLKMPEQSNDYRVVVLGAGGVGKSSLVLRFVQGTFRESYIPTVEDTYRQVRTDNKPGPLDVCTCVRRCARIVTTAGLRSRMKGRYSRPAGQLAI